MKAILFLLLSTLPALCQPFTMADQAFMSAALGQGAAAPVEDSIQMDLMGTTYTSTGLTVGKTNHNAFRFTATKDFTLTRLDIRSTTASVGSMNYTVSLYHDSGGSPGAKVAGDADSDAKSHASFSTPNGTNSFTGFSASITNTGIYWFDAVSDEPNNRGTNIVWWAKDSTFLNNYGKVSPDGSTWTTTVTRQGSMLLWGH